MTLTNLAGRTDAIVGGATKGPFGEQGCGQEACGQSVTCSHVPQSWVEINVWLSMQGGVPCRGSLFGEKVAAMKGEGATPAASELFKHCPHSVV